MADYKKPDHWQLKARKEGYPARSVYKLKEIDEKFGLFKVSGKGGARVLDIGAAPGSWSLYVLRKMDKRGFLAAADLSPLSREFDGGLFEGDNFFFVQGDITAEEVRKELFAKGPYSVIISDAAPSTTGNHTVDAARSYALAEEVIAYAESMLAVGGNLALKVFQGGDSGELLKRMKIIFEKAQSYKPQACRGESVETYYIGIKKK
uniref:Ribosomal RNA large subunit methyltransferase E n=1 Tax=uncultured bacterium contig00003 TaxID=1181495 RepID=A0A806KK65_9BACT|nr:cell division protein FtsJ [uncultured bacterium contig00003]